MDSGLEIPAIPVLVRDGINNRAGDGMGVVSRRAGMADVARRFSTFFEKALVNLVKRRMDIRIVRFGLSTWLVRISSGSGKPMTPLNQAGQDSDSLVWRQPVRTDNMLDR